jgi:hypothetical protein
MKLKINLPTSSFDSIKETMFKVAAIEAELKKEYPDSNISIEIDFVTNRVIDY